MEPEIHPLKYYRFDFTYRENASGTIKSSDTPDQVIANLKEELNDVPELDNLKLNEISHEEYVLLTGPQFAMDPNQVN